ncbi:respiratory nitrate reductase subunit gamma [Rothia sp. ZJ932]|uniref:respiratory nitrate reductase subunit gamma n=1 Tax=Rothia sp. ZJ932 TaxID=2810516 RepID=UPI001966E225|nr:respiratory nitrate reductase subunit gamma [Rothia sp. ZJ932]QRZ62064.1 respiratory nitrate reductase subunit gamma [Rothia sp. ZJ932]
MNLLDLFLWGILPYMSIVILIGGTLWRYKYDQFGWTTRSSQVYESKMLRIASPLFHYGLVGVLAGHIAGLLIPASWTAALGISDDVYHMMALVLGLPFGIAVTVGLVMMVYRRRTTATVFRATTVNDKIMYIFLMGAIVLGIGVTILSAFQGHHGHNYRGDISPWFRSVLIFQPDIELMHNVPFTFKAHIIVAFLLFALWPFTRLVHAFTAPLHYLFRPYIVYRGRGSEGRGARSPRRGWEPLATAAKLSDKSAREQRKNRERASR